jgi:hypothetical protein
VELTQTLDWRNQVKNRTHALVALGAAIFLAGCEGDDGLLGAAGADGADGADGIDGNDGLNSLVAFRDLPVGDADCIGGGQVFETGLDTNRDGVLDAAEVQSTDFIECAVTPTLRALHASPDAPKVNIWVDGAPALPGVDYNMGSGLLAVGLADNVTETGVDVLVEVEAILPGDDPDAIDPDAVFDYALPLAFGTETTVIASGTIEGADFGPIVVTNPIGEAITDGNFRAQVVHAAPRAPAVDVYVTAFDAPLTGPVNGAAPLAPLANTGRLEVLAGDYQIRIVAPTLEGAPVVYDSGEISLPAGADLMIVATENVFLGDSAVQLVVLNDANAEMPAAPLYDTNTPAAAVAVHLSPDAPNVDILADVGSTAEIEQLKLAENIAYTQSCVIEAGAPEDYALSVVATGDTSSVLDIAYGAVVNEGSTVIVSGKVADATLVALPLGVDGRSVFTETKLRLTHGSPSTPNVDIYILPGEGAIGDEGEIKFADIPFGISTDVLSVAPGVYSIYVTVAGDPNPAIAVTGYEVFPGQILDIIARDAFGEETAPQPLVIDYDLVASCAVET